MLINFRTTKQLFLIFFLLMLSIIEATPSANIPEKPMVVIIPSYNNKKWVYENLMSVFKQNYSNYRIIYIDDASTDGTADEVKRLVQNSEQESRFQLVQNSTRKGGLFNLYWAVTRCADEEIVMSLDGDDWFANTCVLKKINEVYSSGDVWITHGTMIEYPQYTLGWSIPIPQEIVEMNAFRTYRCPSHLKTYYAWLFKKIDIEDLKHEGEFFRMTWDQAIMFPMMEMAGERHAFISEVLYIYNTTNPINDNKVDAKLQNDLESLIRSKPRYDKLPASFNPKKRWFF